MANVPDAWPPPSGIDFGTSPVPMFPLPGLFLFPGQILPLHVFEPRYRQMIADSLDGPGRIVIATVLDKDRDALPSRPPVLPTAGIGEIARHERLEDGRFVIWLCGLSRVRIAEVASDRLYRRVLVDALGEIQATDDEDERLRPGLVAGIEKCTGKPLDCAATVPLGALADVLTQCLCVPEGVLAAIHAELEVAERGRKALAAAERFPPRRKT
jgi:Lon protease-like protein